MQKKAGLSVIVSPLDWGLGHATRCIPIIREFLERGAEVILMGSERVLNRLEKEFPDLEKIRTNDVDVKYSTWLPAYFYIAIKSLSINKSEYISYTRLQSEIKKRQIDIIVSDNRYYFRSNDVYSVIISHQIKPRLPFLNGIAGKLMQKFIAKRLEKFDEIWIPDLAERPGVSGALSEFSHLKKPVKHVGYLSRFQRVIQAKGNYGKTVFVASGPEPQQSILIRRFVQIFSGSVSALTILCQMPLITDLHEHINIEIITSASDTEFELAIKDASLIVTRSGYSSVMDLMRLGRRALLIPTPGQTEQEYLGIHLQEFGFSCMTQRELMRITSPEGLIKPMEIGKETNDIDLLSSAVKAAIEHVSRYE